MSARLVHRLDKKQHFDAMRGKKGKKGTDDTKEEHQKFLKKLKYCMYDDGKWYLGWLSSFNFNTGKLKVQFYDDNETTEVKFPDKNVRLIK